MAVDRAVRIAVEGCGHGTLNAIFASIQKACELKGWNGVDLVIIGGDFQAVRNASDLNGMAVPVKYREIGDFQEYYSGQRIAPYPTIFIGGNHEASNHNWELFYGGWVAPNIYFMGAANVVRIGGLRIAGLSGIWKGYDYRKPHFERLPYNQDDLKSIYHVREIDTRRLLQITSQVDVGISHDWPNGVEWMGDHEQLFKFKPYFREDAQRGQLGSIAAMDVLKWLRPYHWFSAHLHCRYAAIVKHKTSDVKSTGKTEDALPQGSNPAPSKLVQNDDEIDLDLDDDTGVEANEQHQPAPTPSLPNQERTDENGGARVTSGSGTGTSASVSEDIRAQLPASFARPEPPSQMPEPANEIYNDETRFLALSKCLAGQNFLQLVEIKPQQGACSSEQAEPLRLEYDPEWLAITRAFADHIKVGDPNAYVPRDAGRGSYHVKIEQERAWVEEKIVKTGKLCIPDNFTMTAPAYDASEGIANPPLPREYNNPQTQAFCSLLEISNPFASSEAEVQARMAQGPRPANDGPRRGGSGGGFRGGRGRGRGGRGRGRGR